MVGRRLVASAVWALAVLGCTPSSAPLPRVPAPAVDAAPPPPPRPVRLVLPRSGRSVVAPPGTRAAAGTIAGSDRIILPDGAELLVRARTVVDVDLEAHVVAAQAHRIRRFERELRTAGTGDDYLYVHRLSQLGERRWAVRRVWPADLDGRVCVGDARDRSTADLMVELCLALAPLKRP